jgi:hypothetical protein
VSDDRLRSGLAWLILAAQLTAGVWFSWFGPSYGARLWISLVPLVAGGAATVVYITQLRGVLDPVLFVLMPVGSLAVILGILLFTWWLAWAGVIAILAGVGLTQFMFFREKTQWEKLQSLLLVGSIVAFLVGGWIGPAWLMWLGIWTFGGLLVLTVVFLVLPKNADREGAG